MAMAICATFMTMNVLSIILLIRNCRSSEKRNITILLLSVIFLHSLCRTLYFINWVQLHIFDPECLPLSSTNSNSTMAMNILGTLPEGFFLSSISINIHAFSHMIYLTINAKIAVVHCFSMVQHIVNVSVYFWLGLYYFMSTGPYIHLIISTLNGLVIITEVSNAGFFLFFSSLLWRKFSTNRERSSILVTMNPSKSAIKVLFCTSCICFAALITKANLLIFNIWNNGDYELWSLPLFFIFGEFVPQCTMIVIQNITQRHLDYCYKSVSTPQMGSLLGSHLSTIDEERTIYSQIFAYSHSSILKGTKEGFKSGSYQNVGYYSKSSDHAGDKEISSLV